VLKLGHLNHGIAFTTSHWRGVKN